MSVEGPYRPTLDFCNVFSVVSRLSPQFPSQVHDVPTLQTLRISAQQVAYGLLSPAGFLPAPLLVVVALQIAHLDRANFTALILKLSTVRKAESHI